MKNAPQNLLVVLAIALCGLCAWQWYAESIERATLVDRNQLILKLETDAQSSSNSMKSMDAEITGLQKRVNELKLSAATNDNLIMEQKREMLRLQFSNDNLTNAIAQYKTGVEQLQGKLKEAFDGIQKQNDAIKTLTGQRDEFIQKYNDSVKARNDLTAKYNELVERINKQQSAPAPGQ